MSPFRRLLAWLLCGAMALLLIGPIGKRDRAGAAGVAGDVHRTSPARRVDRGGTVVGIDRTAAPDRHSVAAACDVLQKFEAIAVRDDIAWRHRAVALRGPDRNENRSRGPPAARTSVLAA
jgi:hypothetical protein